MLPRTHWQRHVARLDPETDYEEIYRVMSTLEFPWDMVQSLSFALFRTYAVPSIGRLLDRTGEFEHACQKRYDDTTLLLEAPSRHGLRSDEGRRAIRRVNQMHGSYDIAEDDMRYVLSTFVVVPKRWMDDFGWRPFSPAEVRASVLYYRDLGRLMGIRDAPEDYDGFARLMDDHEAAHFAPDPASRRVADATLGLMRTFYPRGTGRGVDLFSVSLMDPPLRSALGYPDPPAAVVRTARAGMRARARVEALMPSRSTPSLVEDSRRMRSYPHGFVLEHLGTFPRGTTG